MGPISFRRLSLALLSGQDLIDSLRSGNLDGVKSALTAGADPNLVLPEHGIAPMHLAAGSRHEKFGLFAVEILLDAGGDPNVPSGDGEGVTPLHVAAAWGRTEIVALLLEAGGNPMIKDADGLSATDYAKREGNRAILNMMKEHSIKNPCYPNKSMLYYDDTNGMGEASLPVDLPLNREAITILRCHRRYADLFESEPGRCESPGPSNVARPDSSSSHRSVRQKNSHPSITSFNSHHYSHELHGPTEIIHRPIPKKVTKSSHSFGHCQCTTMTNLNSEFKSHDLLSDASDNFSNEILLKYLLSARAQCKLKKRISLSSSDVMKELLGGPSKSEHEFSSDILQSYMIKNIKDYNYCRSKAIFCKECHKRVDILDKYSQTDMGKTKTSAKCIQVDLAGGQKTEQAYEPGLREVLSEVREQIIKSKTARENLEEFTYDPRAKLRWNKLGNIPSPSAAGNSIYPATVGGNSSANIRENNSVRERGRPAEVWEAERVPLNSIQRTRARHSATCQDRRRSLNENDSRPFSVIWDTEEYCSDPITWPVIDSPSNIEPTTYLSEGKPDNFKDQFTSFNVVTDEEHITGTKELPEKKCSPGTSKMTGESIIRGILKGKSITRVDKNVATESENVDVMKQMALASKMVTEIISSLKSKEVNLSLNGVTVNCSPEKLHRESKASSKCDHKRVREKFSSRQGGSRRKSQDATKPEEPVNKRSGGKKKETPSPKQKDLSSCIQEMTLHLNSINNDSKANYPNLHVDENKQQETPIVNKLPEASTNPMIDITEPKIVSCILKDASHESVNKDIQSSLPSSADNISEKTEGIAIKIEHPNESLTEEKKHTNKIKSEIFLQSISTLKETTDEQGLELNYGKPKVGAITVTRLKGHKEIIDGKVVNDEDCIPDIQTPADEKISESGSVFITELKINVDTSCDEYKLPESMTSYSLYHSAEESVNPIIQTKESKTTP